MIVDFGPDSAAGLYSAAGPDSDGGPDSHDIRTSTSEGCAGLRPSTGVSNWSKPRLQLEKPVPM